jgi:hypothetical protein
MQGQSLAHNRCTDKPGEEVTQDPNKLDQNLYSLTKQVCANRRSSSPSEDVRLSPSSIPLHPSDLRRPFPFYKLGEGSTGGDFSRKEP